MTDSDAPEIDAAFRLELPCGRVAVIDEDDFDLLHGFRLYSEVRKHTTYVQCHKRGLPHGRYVYLHVLIMGRRYIDHRDGDGLNNRRGNLRPATNAENSKNGPKRDGAVPFKGIREQRGRYFAQICVDYKMFSGSSRETPEEAARDYDELARKHHGEFARLNFPVINVD